MSDMTRAEQAKAALFWDAVAEDAKSRSREARAELTAAATEELRREGIAPTWRVPGIGTVPLQITSPAVDVADPDAYAAWVAVRYPDEIETVRRVRPAFDERLRRAAVKYGDPPCTADGEVIPGLVFRPGGAPRGIQIRPDAPARQMVSDAARLFLDAAHEKRAEVEAA